MTTTTANVPWVQSSNMRDKTLDYCDPSWKQLPTVVLAAEIYPLWKIVTADPSTFDPASWVYTNVIARTRGRLRWLTDSRLRLDLYIEVGKLYHNTNDLNDIPPLTLTQKEDTKKFFYDAIDFNPIPPPPDKPQTFGTVDCWKVKVMTWWKDRLNDDRRRKKSAPVDKGYGRYGQGGFPAPVDRANDAATPTWVPGQQGLVPVQRGSPDWNEVLTLFLATAANYKVENIERVQDTKGWTRFQAFKKTNPHTRPNEMRLFHGTSRDTVDAIITKGFDRNFTTTHYYGMGTYFARDARYSTDDRYSKPTANGDKHMFLTRVVVGDYCLGHASDKAPPRPRPGATKPTDLCDSTTDSDTHPTIFVTYNDAQQYPEYLITFRKV